MDHKSLDTFKNLFEAVLFEAREDEGFEVLRSNFSSDAGLAQTGDEVDQSNHLREDSLERKLKWRRALYLRKIRRALERIQVGAFGECEDCGGDIEPKRLMARPTAEMCISCKEDAEAIEGHIAYKRKSHTEGKSLITGEDDPLNKHEMERDKVLKFLSTAKRISERAVETTS